ncbi:AAA family ATPase [Brevundimonas sp. M20]|uniref:AAA family ATPase n=1 Tax=Brevundimonas sp. M20 TaxID=2591463 RepID=UPI001146A710|nr:AAA family ATPase [Brevundimonas sp. M20]QDH74284.1 AAA family ATPase [Brevundimonas sp. M20]
MGNAPYFLRTLLVQGFRAYLDPKTFDFTTQRSLAVFAPNGHGKSSIVDALEFAFSDDGSLERLGVRAIHNKAGVSALAHHLADDRKIVASVSTAFRRGTEDSEGNRGVAGKRVRAPAATDVQAQFVVAPIIRGHALRSFVEAQTAEQRYESVATWLQLGPLVNAQRNLRSLRRGIKAAAEDESPFTSINTQLSKETSQVVQAWNADALLAYVNDVVIAPLDSHLRFAVLTQEDPAFVTLSERSQAEEKRLGLEGMRQIRNALAALYEVVDDPDTGQSIDQGLIVTFSAAVAAKAETAKAFAVERAAATEAAFAAVWKEAEPLFAEDATFVVAECPLCLTPIANSVAGGAAGVHQHIADRLAALKDYAEAKKNDEAAAKSLAAAHTRLAGILKTITLPDNFQDARDELGLYRTVIDAWKDGTTPDAAPAISAVLASLTTLDTAIADIEKKQGAHTYAKAKAKVDRLLAIRTDQELAERTATELTALSDELTAQSAFVSGEIRIKLQVLLDGLRKPVNDIYRAIQGNSAAPVRLELPPEEDDNQQRLNLLIDFSDNRQGVQPGGYLSDSQIHSLALALRLAAIKAFNTNAPIVALDDVVTSYDADHRRTIAALLANEFAGFQLIITTHDERFYLYLRDQLGAADWRFTRIIRLDRDYGPRFADEKVTDAMIQTRWAAGESAANEMRQAEEEWLLSICRDFGVNLRIRSLERAYSYERSELAAALATFLNGAKITIPLVPGVNNRFLTSLQQGVVENFGSHFQEGPYGDGSKGDEQARWAEFSTFKAFFACSKCARTRFKRPHDFRKPVCAHGSCEAQFEGSTPPVK